MVGLRGNKFDISTPNNLIALAMTIVQRKIARHWRHVQRQRRLESGVCGDLLPDLSLLGGNEDPAKAAEFNDQLRRVYYALDANERRVLQLRLDGYTIAEVARSMGIEPHLLRVRLGRLRDRRADRVDLGSARVFFVCSVDF
jgi:RNA polymerase sigma-70 factor (ECF subfamily)